MRGLYRASSSDHPAAAPSPSSEPLRGPPSPPRGEGRGSGEFIPHFPSPMHWLTRLQREKPFLSSPVACEPPIIVRVRRSAAIWERESAQGDQGRSATPVAPSAEFTQQFRIHCTPVALFFYRASNREGCSEAGAAPIRNPSDLSRFVTVQHGLCCIAALASRRLRGGDQLRPFHRLNSGTTQT